MSYIPADMVMCNYGLSKEAWEKLQKVYKDHLDAHPVCELCRDRPSVRITPLGTILASCKECIDKQRQEMIEEYEREHKWDEEYGEY